MLYAEAREMLKRGRNGQRKYANNTYMRLVGEDVHVRLHNTDVVVIHPDDSMTLDSGGWRTPTTKERICSIIGWKVGVISQDKGLWYYLPHGIGWQDKEKWVMFADGLTIAASGKVISGAGDLATVEAAKRKVDKFVKKYIDGFVKHVEKNGMQYPVDESASFVGLRRLVQDMSSCHYPGLLLWHATVDRRYGKPDFVYQMHMMGLAKEGRDKRHDLEWVRDVLRSFFRKRKTALMEEMQLQQQLGIH